MPRRWKLLVAAGVTLAILAALFWAYLRLCCSPPAEPVVTLRVNRSPVADVSAGAPVIFELFVSGTHVGQEIAIGSRLMPWHRLVHFEVADRPRYNWRRNHPTSLGTFWTGSPP